MTVVCKANIMVLEAGDYFVFLVIDIIFAIMIVIWKFVFPRMEKTISPKEETSPQAITSLKELNQSKDYVVFANYIYDVEPLRIDHPAGFQIVESVKNKEVDRYIYGMFASE